MASFLSNQQAVISHLSAAMQHDYKGVHRANLHQTLTELHQKYTTPTTSCAKAFYTTVYRQEQAIANLYAEEHTPLLLPNKLPHIAPCDLFKNDKFHPILDHLIKEHPLTQRFLNPRLYSLIGPFSITITNRQDGRDSHISVPLYIFSKEHNRLESPYISARDAETLIPSTGPRSSEVNAQKTVHSGAIFIYARVPIANLSEEVTFVAYETKAQPDSLLNGNTKAAQAIEAAVENLPHPPQS